MATQFSWIPFYRELTQRLLTFEDKQAELIQLLEAMRAEKFPVVPLEDDQPGGGRLPLTVIDPFTFLATFARTYSDSTLRLCQWIKKKWNLSADLPSDFEGLALLNARNSWFFSSVHGGRAGARRPDDIPLLWQAARTAFDSTAEQFDPMLYSQCRDIPNCGQKKLTTGLFWVSPNGFLPLGGAMLPFLKARGAAWDNSALWGTRKGGDLKAYCELINSAHEIHYNHAALVKEAQAWAKNHPDDGDDTAVELPTFPLNTILYGPPGTGKTFSSVAQAVKIIDGDAPEDRDECMARFEELSEAKQIGFVTFHQTFAYEEFIEGLRPVVDESTEGGARYAVRDGLFKEMALRALGACLDRTDPKQRNFDDLWFALLHNIQSRPQYRINSDETSEVSYRLDVTAERSLRAININAESLEVSFCSARYVEKAWDDLRDDPEIDSNSVTKAVGDMGGCDPYLIANVVKELKKYESSFRYPYGQPDNPKKAAHSYLAGSHDYCLKAALLPTPRFVLIVDEINRGNISKIFGELITLLEEDKRLGKTNRLRVILPYSGDTFALPPNLYLLGTMNTADKSLALLDVALRRRFTFKELNPDFSICKLPDITMQKALEELNRRIMRVLDREHRIGHAFFMNVKTTADFNDGFADKIVPLLQEYFYNDWDGLRGVLGEKDDGRIVGTMSTIDGVRGRNHFAWWRDLDKLTPNFLDVLRKNYGIANSAANIAQPDNAVTDVSEAAAEDSTPNASPDTA